MISSVPVTEKLVALSFDDGPNPSATPELLNVLDNKGAKATFFLVGKHVAAYPEIAAEIANRGHDIGNHSFSHRFMLSMRTAPMLAELIKTNEAIETAAGQLPSLFRPPYLLEGPGLKRAVHQLDMQSVGAITTFKTIRFQDWTIQDQPEKIAQIALEAAQPGNILLLHDGHAGAKSPSTQNYRGGTVTAVTMIIDTLQKQGYQFVTVSSLLQHNQAGGG